MTQTLNHLFGSCVALPGEMPGAGLLLNNTMALFDPDPRPGYERGNAVASRKRMLSSMSPTIVLKAGKPYFALGTPGGTRIYATVLQGILNVIDHGMSIQQAVEAPRIWTMMYGDLNVEEGVPADTRIFSPLKRTLLARRCWTRRRSCLVRVRFGLRILRLARAWQYRASGLCAFPEAAYSVRLTFLDRCQIVGRFGGAPPLLWQWRGRLAWSLS